MNEFPFPGLIAAVLVAGCLKENRNREAVQGNKDAGAALEGVEEKLEALHGNGD